MAKANDDQKPEHDGLKDDTAPDATTAGFVARVAEASGTAAPVEPVDTAPQPTAPLSKIVRPSRFAEITPPTIEIPAARVKAMTRREFLLFGTGAVVAAAGFWWVLPTDTQDRLLPGPLRKRYDALDPQDLATDSTDNPPAVAENPLYKASMDERDRFLNKVIDFDDDVAEALYSPDRTVPTYPRTMAVRDLRNNYDGATPDESYLDTWTLTVTGLASGKPLVLRKKDLLRFAHHDQVTRLCCVEGWSAIVWWGGLRFADFLRAYPPMPGARWAHMTSSVNLDSNGNSDPYYVSIDLPTARHPQTLLATHYNGAPLDTAHGAPMRLVAPMKLGLKNIKAVTNIDYVVKEPSDYWNERGYSKYDGL